MDIRETAIRLARESGAVSYSRAPMRSVVGVSLTYDQLERLVRAAMAEGLKMGVGVCDEQVGDAATVAVAKGCAAALRAKAEEISKSCS